jgi:hypothetical protein
MNTKEFIIFMTSNVIAKPNANQPARVPGRFRKGDIEGFVILLLQSEKSE